MEGLCQKIYIKHIEVGKVLGDKVVGGSDHARVREGKRSGRGSGNIRLVRSNHARVHLSDHARVREGKPRRTIMELEGEG